MMRKKIKQISVAFYDEDAKCYKMFEEFAKKHKSKAKQELFKQALLVGLMAMDAGFSVETETRLVSNQ